MKIGWYKVSEVLCMDPMEIKNIENLFESLTPEDKIAILRHGISLYLSSLKKRLFLAQAKIRQFEEKYQISLDQLDKEGLPDDADYQLHEDYLMWHHWADNIGKLKKQIDTLDSPATHGLYTGEELYVSN